MRRRAALVALVACVAALVVGVDPAGAVVTTIACGQLVETDVVLQADVGPCPGHGFVVQGGASNNVTIDLNGHRIAGIPNSLPGPGGPNAGIRVAGTTGVTIKNGTITGFAYGVQLSSAHRSTITNMTIADNRGPPLFGNHTGAGIYMFIANDNIVRGNRIIHNGPLGGIVVDQSGGALIENNDVQDNNFRNIGGDLHNFPGQITQQDIGILIRGGDTPPRGDGDRRGGHIVRNNRVVGSGYHGIALSGFTGDDVVAGNTVTDSGLDQPADPRSLTFGDGIHVGSVAGNVVENNTITRSGGNGIFVQVGGNTMRRNTAVLNSRRAGLLPTFDLKDNRGGCPGNTWSQNRFLTFNQACVTT